MELNTVEEIEAFSQKNIYSDEEKKYIIEQLNAKRLSENKEENLSKQYKKYTPEEKDNILKELNDKRLEKQLYEEIEKRRIHNKKLYTFDMREFYKFLHMDREYFIELKDLDLLSNRPQILTLYFRTFGEIKKRDFLIKTEIYSDRIFISNDVLRVYFKGYSLENER
ncbi:MAG TPA: hypothetical protein EYG78_04240 [Sulfurovum sp.]|nr:hypothetical protein [Sulfurovum sp.]